MQRRAEEEEQRRKEGERGPQEEEEVVPDEGLVYVDEIGMNQQERQQNRRFKKKDQYHLPDLDVSLNEMGGPNDPRIMSLEELQAYARHFETGEDINVYDFSKIDYDSPFFMSLPASDRYNILNAARLRSRLRMGHSKEQLDSMFPDRMAFSKFQIERVRERNELTQRLMHINEGGDTLFNGGGRVAGEKGREYVLVKNDGVEGGWALGVISDEGTKQETAIDVDKPAPVAKREDEEWENEDDFEDVPIEGLNRLPKRPRLDPDATEAFAKQRQAFYKSSKSGAKRRPKRTADSNSLFVTNEMVQDDGEEWEELDDHDELFGEPNGAIEEEDADLQRAIAMSLENDAQVQMEEAPPASDAEDDDMPDVFQQSAVPESRPLPKGSGRAIASIVNKRAFDTAPESREVTSFGVPGPKPVESHQMSDDEGDSMDLQAALAESRKTKRKSSLPKQRHPAPSKPAVDPAAEIAKQAGFSGPLPFEKLDLGSSLLGKQKMQERSEDAAGGFVNPELASHEEKKKAEPLPPWFAGDPEEGIQRQKELERRDREMERDFRKTFQFEGRGESGLRKETSEVIDLEADEAEKGLRNGEVIDLEAEDENNDEEMELAAPVDTELRMGDVAEKVPLEPPRTMEEDHPVASPTHFDETQSALNQSEDKEVAPVQQVSKSPILVPDGEIADESEDEEMLEWSESEDEREKASRLPAAKPGEATGILQQKQLSRSPSAEFEDVGIPDEPIPPGRSAQQNVPEEDETIGGPAPASGFAHQESIPDDADLVEFDDFSDPEDEELLRQLTLEAEEHARFASTWNNKSQAQNIADYEKELKQLRNQQKKDRRDADEVTHIMITECQQLLRLFGLPYITAPMEAEAQCAELVRLGLVDGIVTDDSDCFLFGGTRIYKNMFNQAKFVECYLTSDLEKEFDLTRDKLIQVAHLLGSDYTEGLPGVGPVTALEILGEFQTLQEFKDWWSGVQMNTIPKSQDANKPFRKKFRRNATKLFLPPTFPDTRVDVAYTQPDVDPDPEAFQWGVPDLEALRSFLMATIGWSQERTDEVLVPVIRDMNRRADEGTQSNITAFFDGGVGIGTAGTAKSSVRGDAFAPRKRVAESSKRMGNALNSMADRAKRHREGNVVQEDGDGVEDGHASGEQQASANGARKQKVKKATSKRRRRPESVSFSEAESEFSEPAQSMKKRTAPNNVRKGRKKKLQVEE